MDDDLSGFDLVHKAGDILVIFAFGLREARIFADTFQTVLPVDLNGNTCDSGDLFCIGLPPREGDHVSGVECRIADGC